MQAILTTHDGNVSTLTVRSHTIANSKGKSMSLLSVTPDTACPDKPVKITLLADNLPNKGDIAVVFSTPGVEPVHGEIVYQHHNHALQVMTPCWNMKMADTVQVEIKVIRISNNTHTEPLSFSFLSPQAGSNIEAGIEHSEVEFNLPFNNPDILESSLIQTETPSRPDLYRVVTTRYENDKAGGNDMEMESLEGCLDEGLHAENAHHSIQTETPSRLDLYRVVNIRDENGQAGESYIETLDESLHEGLQAENADPSILTFGMSSF